MKLTPFLAAVLIAGAWTYPCMAQSDPSEDGARSQAQSDFGMQSRSRAQDDDDWDRDRDWIAGPRGHHGHHYGMGRGPWDRMGMTGMMQERGARFSFRRGNARIDIRCPPQERLQNCVDAASELIDKVSRMGAAERQSGGGRDRDDERLHSPPDRDEDRMDERALPQRL